MRRSRRIDTAPTSIDLVRPAALVILATAFVVPFLKWMPLANAQSTVIGITVRHQVRGAERTPNFAYRFEMQCSRSNGAPIGAPLAFDLAGGIQRTFGAGDIPGLTAADNCSVRTLDNNGAESIYSSSAAMRADGSQPDAVPGIIGQGGYRSAPTPADGQTISIVSTFGGDVVLSKRVDGASADSIALYELKLNCDGGFSRSVLLGNGQQQVLTGIPAGVTCRVTETRGGGAAARFADNSGAPSDGVVIVVATTAACWDLRNAAPECRAAIVVTNQFDSVADSASSVPPTTTEETTTTTPDVAPAETASPAAPAIQTVTDAELAYTG